MTQIFCDSCPKHSQYRQQNCPKCAVEQVQHTANTNIVNALMRVPAEKWRKAMGTDNYMYEVNYCHFFLFRVVHTVLRFGNDTSLSHEQFPDIEKLYDKVHRYWKEHSEKDDTAQIYEKAFGSKMNEQ